MNDNFLNSVEKYVRLKKELDSRVSIMQNLINNGDHIPRPVNPLPRRTGFNKAILGRRPWTTTDIDQLLHLVRRKKPAKVNKMCKALHRTPSAISNKLYELREKNFQNLGAFSQKRHRKWTPDEKQRMMEMHENGADYKKIASALGIKPNKVSAMISQIKKNGVK